MHKARYCVYNTTRESFLSLGVAAADTTFSRLKGLIGKLTLRFDDGLWVVPSSGVHSIGVFFPLDLIYLDEGNQVVHMVESLPSFRIAPLRTQAASVLELPTHSIFSSQTQIGDHLVICMPEEMEDHLKAKPGNNDLSGDPTPEPKKEVEMAINQSGTITNWLQSLFSRERRSSNRQASTNLAAHFWTGAAPAAQEVRDISPTGLFLKTDERWYPGTVVTMTLQKTDENPENADRSIVVTSQAVRTDKDGVGLAFILPESSTDRAADKKSLIQFLRTFQRGKN